MGGARQHLQASFPATEDAVTAEPLTVAVIVCQYCAIRIDVALWRGKDALRVGAGVSESVRSPGITWCVSHGICEACAEKDAPVDIEAALSAGLMTRSEAIAAYREEYGLEVGYAFVHPEAADYERHAEFLLERFVVRR